MSPSGRYADATSAAPQVAAPDIVRKILPGIGDLMPGPLLPFADLAASGDGRILIGADGAGAVLALSRA